MQPVNPQEQQCLMPVFQNIAAQQQNQNAALAQQNQLVQQAGQTAKSGGMNPQAMAAMLRKGDKPTQDQMNQQLGQTGQGGNDPMALAIALRKKDDKKKPANVYDKSQAMPDMAQSDPLDF